MGHLEISHEILTTGSDFESCRGDVQRFFARTMLIHYDEVLVREEESVNGTEKNFRVRLREGLQANREVLGKFLADLKDEGFSALDDLQAMEKGYLSKILHLIAHLQDGFIGIDSRFYNLAEDSHGVSKSLQQKIDAAPQKYWILKVTGRIASGAEDPLDALRTFEGRRKQGV